MICGTCEHEPAAHFLDGATLRRSVCATYQCRCSEYVGCPAWWVAPRARGAPTMLVTTDHVADTIMATTGLEHVARQAEDLRVSAPQAA